MAQAAAAAPQVDLSWMQVPTEWNTRAKPDEARPDARSDQHRQVRRDPGRLAVPDGDAARRRADPRRRGHGLLDLPEAGSVERRLRPAVRRGDPAPLAPRDRRAVGRASSRCADDLERAICQICTHISEKEQMEADVLGRWEPEISYGYHEVKLYLATTIFENARAVEVFRKRALSNGGGLGVQSPGWGFRSVVDARNFTEMAVDPDGAAGQPDAGAVRVRREVREEPGREVHLRARACRTRRATSPTASRT